MLFQARCRGYLVRQNIKEKSQVSDILQYLIMCNISHVIFYLVFIASDNKIQLDILS